MIENMYVNNQIYICVLLYNMCLKKIANESSQQLHKTKSNPNNSDYSPDTVLHTLAYLPL